MQWNAALYDGSHGFVSQFGAGILAYLHPMPGESILDIGCGTGDLTHEILLSGVTVTGIDSSEEMITAAKAKYPDIEFLQMDARRLEFQNRFDAIFSNAALHWIPEKELVIQSMYSALKRNGRIVVEFGGKGNVEQMLTALIDILVKRGHGDNAKTDFWYFPSIGEYASELERLNFSVLHAEHFSRNTVLPAKNGLKKWFTMFGDNFFVNIPAAEKEFILQDVQNQLQRKHYINGNWNADYRRIRIVAVKES
jgi:trans-aconitate methyltransferase